MLRLISMACGCLLVMCGAALWMDYTSTPEVCLAQTPLQEGWPSEPADVRADERLMERLNNPSSSIGPAIEPNGLV